MNRPENARDMDRSTTVGGGSIRRARERAAAGGKRESFGTFQRNLAQETQQQQQQQAADQQYPPQRPPPVSQPQWPAQQQQMPRRPPNAVQQLPSQGASPVSRRPVLGDSSAGPTRIPRPQAPAGLQNKDGQIGMAISRPTQIPQWPLAGPLASPPSSADGEPYRPPAGRSQPPQRPPRPSRVPSMLDGSRIQDPTPSFQYTPQSSRDSELSIPQTASTTSRASDVSSVASIPDFPMPANAPVQQPVQVPMQPVIQPPMQPPRRSVNLGPPPSSRRGATSFYSNASFVSPIPEESTHTRSHTSLASSAAMPDTWNPRSPGQSPNSDQSYEDYILEEGRESNASDDDERGLVRSASIGKRAKPALVTTLAVPRNGNSPESRPGPSPVQNSPFSGGTGYVNSTSSSSVGQSKSQVGTAVTADDVMNALAAAGSTNPGTSNKRNSMSPPDGDRGFSRLSAIRRPPKLDIDAVHKAEARGSLTSLPDLIRRATRLAASLEKGRRPASRLDDLDFFAPANRAARDPEKERSSDYEKHQSGLSDMLAAFPPPAQANRRSIRQSIRDQVGSWPLPININRSQNITPGQEELESSVGDAPERRKRRCCGLPLWAFIVVLVIVLLIIAAAVVIPVEFLVIRRQSAEGQAQAAIEQCRNQLRCANGGVNFVSPQNVCSCLCTNGFTGNDCSIAGSTGCTTTDLPQSSGTNMILNNATLGNAIPRLIQDAQGNFSIPLSAAPILAKLNSGSLSCGAQNALVTFDGSPGRISNNGLAQAQFDGSVMNFRTTITVAPGMRTTIFLGPPAPSVSMSFSTIISAPTSVTTTFMSTISFSTTIPPAPTPPPPPPATTSAPAPGTTPGVIAAPPAANFAVTEEIADFGRVVVLYILQEESFDNAITAQRALQAFFTEAGRGLANGEGRTSAPVGGVSVDRARNVNLGNGNTADLVAFQVDIGNGRIGRGVTTTKVRRRWHLAPVLGVDMGV